MKTLYFNQTGPLIRFDGKFLHVEDLNPEVQTKWRMSRLEMLTLGFRAIVASFKAKP